MKKFLKRLLFVVVILGIFSGLGWYSYKSGWLEKKLSTTSVPFEFFRTDNNKSINEMTVKNEGNRSAEALKKELSGLTSLFNSETVTKPDISSAPLTDSGKEELNKILEPIYGVENQFVGESHVTGFVQDKDGWNPVVTFSVFNDTSSIQNISSETTDEFAYSELPDDFNVTYLDQIISQDDKFYKNKQWQNLTSTVPEEVTDVLSKNYPNTTSRVVYFDSTTIVKIYHAVSTPEKVKYIVRTQSLDSANSSVYSLNIE